VAKAANQDRQSAATLRDRQLGEGGKEPGDIWQIKADWQPFRSSYPAWLSSDENAQAIASSTAVQGDFCPACISMFLENCKCKAALVHTYAACHFKLQKRCHFAPAVLQAENTAQPDKPASQENGADQTV